MIEIRLIDSKATAEVCKDFGFSINGVILVYEAVDNSERLGYCVFSIKGDMGRLYQVVMCGKGLMSIADGLIRSTLSLMFRRGVTIAVCTGGVDSGLLLGIGFKQTVDEWKISLTESFFAGCGH